MTFNDYFAPRFGFGWLLALIVLLLCVAAYFFGLNVSQAQILLLIALLAVSRLT